MKAIVVLTFDLPTPDDIVAVLDKMNPQAIPHFANEARIAVGDDAEHVINWLDEEN